METFTNRDVSAGDTQDTTQTESVGDKQDALEAGNVEDTQDKTQTGSVGDIQDTTEAENVGDAHNTAETGTLTVSKENDATLEHTQETTGTPENQERREIEDSDSDEEKCGMKRPNLLEQLRTILDTYPDDAQIIKELIQNAEDANATEIKLLHDKRVIEPGGEYGKYLKAPALCVYNDATFTDEDWDGIISIYNSIKKNNKLKVGRFGLGFKSVFHMTDHPIIISGDKMLIIDPLKSQKSEDEVCEKIRLKRLAKPKYKNTLSVILNTFGCNQDVLNKAEYNGTLFWFPLRNKTSALSDNIYTQKKVNELFDTFEEEAPIVLLFLKSLVNVDVFERSDQSPEQIKQLYTVSMTGLNNDLNERARFKNDVLLLNGELPTTSVWSTYDSTVTLNKAGCISEKDWAIVNYIQGTNESSETLTSLAKDTDLSYSPYVGIAYPFAHLNDENAGHVFCFLPLPLGLKSLTGLPVHVNGLFALEQNRRHVKWGTKDQSKLHTNKDKHVQWNEILIRDVLSKAYEHLVVHLVDRSRDHQNLEQCVTDVHASIPTPSLMDDKWEILLEQLLSALLNKDIFFTRNHGGRWISQSDAIFPVFNPVIDSREVETTITKIILQAGKDFVSIPGNIIEVLMDTKYNACAPEGITPPLLRDVLQACNEYSSYSRDEKLYLLEFACADGEFSSLEGIDLLPLSDESFGTFQTVLSDEDERIFVCENGEEDLFPDLGHRFISTRKLSSDKLITRLKELAESGIFQLAPMHPDYFPSLYKKAIKKNFQKKEEGKKYVPLNDAVNIDWLEKVWRYIGVHFLTNDDLKILHLLPLIAEKQIESDQIKELLPLKGFYVAGHCDGISSWPQDIDHILPFFSITKITLLPDFLKNLLGKFIKYPNHENMYQLLSDVLQDVNAREISDSFNIDCQPKYKEALIDFLSGTAVGIPSNVKSFLRNLWIFRVSTNVTEIPNTTRGNISLEENNNLVPNTKLPVRYPYSLIEPKNFEVEQFALKLGAQMKEPVKLVTDILEKMQNESDIYSREDKQEFMDYVLKNISLFDEKVIELAKEVAFVPSSGKNVFRAKDLFDPREENIRILFTKEDDKFPTSPYEKDDELNALLKIGLMKSKDVTFKDLLETAKVLDSMSIGQVNRVDILKKAAELKFFLHKSPSYKTETEHIYVEKLKNLRWVPVMERPTSYPTYLPWYSEDKEIFLSTPRDVTSSEFTELSGSVQPIVDVRSKYQLFEEFSWNLPPNEDIIFKQLNCIARNFKPEYRPKLLPLVASIYDHLNNSCSNLDIFQETDFILCENTFKNPCDVYILQDKEHDTLNLSPYMCKLPSEFVHLEHFFLTLGCKQTMSYDIAITVLEKIKLKHDHNSESEQDIKNDTRLVFQILHYIDSLCLSDEEMENVLLPVFDKNNRLVLKYPSECTYSDGDTDWLFDATDETTDEKINYVHKDIGPSLANRFGVPSLTKRFLTDDDSDEMVMEWGQSEPLTTRLNNLLEGYSDGLAIPKEIVQNADDAGASEVAFLYDERENMDARSRLIDTQMAECQGPALWAYNNAMFQESDFENIIKLGGRTKEKDESTIGKFGLGFCSVYNLTDVPSFYSGTSMVIFDPHGNHLGKAIKDKTNPGIRFKINQRILKNMQNQFRPFNGIFGCDLTGFQDQHEQYKGTLFRFPLRTKLQAATSEIKNLYYSRQEMIELLNMFMKSAGNLLLFTQNIRDIKVYHLPTAALNPTEKMLLFSAKKNNTLTIPKHLQDTNVLKHFKENNNEDVALISQFEISLEMTVHAHELSNITPSCRSTSWVVAWGFSKDRSTCIKGGVPVGATAVPVVEDNQGIFPMEMSKLLDGFYKSSHLFCFLPLPVELSLLFHVNGYFAIENDRKGLTRVSSDEKSSENVVWNKALFSDAVCNAFLTMLSAFSKSSEKNYKYSSLWPKLSSNDTELGSLFVSFYKKIVLEHDVFRQDGKWFSFKECSILDPVLRFSCDIGDVAFNCFLHFYDKGEVVHVEEEVMQCFKAAGCGDYVEERVVKAESFYRNVFFPNISSGYWQMSDNRDMDRDRLTLYALDCESSVLHELIEMHECIPTRRCGTLRKPEGLVHPEGLASTLFDDSDERFPMEIFCNKDRLDVLSQLGMKTDQIPLNWLKDRAESVKRLAAIDAELALKRCIALLEYMKFENSVENYNDLKQLSKIEFLPVKNKPVDWPLTWKGDETVQPVQENLSNNHEGNSNDENLSNNRQGNSNDGTRIQIYASPENLFLPKVQSLIGCIEAIAYTFETRKYDRVLEQVGINNYVTVRSVIDQLKLVDTVIVENIDDRKKKQLQEICFSIYDYLNSKCKDDRYKAEICQLCDDLRSMKILFTEDTNGNGILINPSIMAFNVPRNTTSRLRSVFDCRPVLFFVDSHLKRYEHFLKIVGVHEQFALSHILDSISEQKERHGDEPCTDTDVMLVVNLIKLLERKCDIDKTALTYEQISSLIVPDDKSVLRSPNDLCFDDDYGKLGKMPFMNFVHSAIDVGLMRFLGIKSKRVQHLKSFADGMDFGQKEKLVTRLKGILEGYPFDSTILNELLQNADDAGASEIHFILDERYHSTQGMFDDSWKPLQGPSLLVYNDTCFTESDIKGIQNLGEGNKSTDATKTGQFGLGFNATYHLTDVPSFLTRGKRTPNGGTLCIFDPNCRYAPLARPESPGMKLPDLNIVKQYYPGVYNTYLQTELPSKKGTWFRFPLRDVKMSEVSEIRPDKAITVKDIEELFETFRVDMLKALLFVSNVKLIRLSRVSAKRKDSLDLIYEVTASLSDDDRSRRASFNRYVKTSMKKQKEGKCLLSDLEDKEVDYKLFISDNTGNVANWIIVQKFGVGDKSKVPEILTEAIKNGDIGLSPRGGVALPLMVSTQLNFPKGIPMSESTISDKPNAAKEDHKNTLTSTVTVIHKEQSKSLISSKVTETAKIESDFDETLDTQNNVSFKISKTINKQTENGDYRAFCFLPTPIRTGLPLHINGHFILDPARRNLWRDENASIKGVWNRMLIEEIIPTAYTIGIESLKKHIVEMLTGKKKKQRTVSAQEALDFYHLAFPAVSDERDKIWGDLVNSFYRIIEEKEVRLFPVQNFLSTLLKDKKNREITWVALSESGHMFPAYFNDLNDQFQNSVMEKRNQEQRYYLSTDENIFNRNKHKQKELTIAVQKAQELAHILKDLGLKLVDSPLWIFNSIENAKVKVSKISPDVLIKFIQSRLDNSPDRCRIEMLDCQSNREVLKGVHSLLSYCLKSELFASSMENLPLLVTDDGELRCFLANDPVFVSEFCELLPRSAYQFAHREFVGLLRALVGEVRCLIDLDIEHFASLLPFSLESSVYEQISGLLTEWNPEQPQIPNKTWLKLFWRYLSKRSSKENIKTSLENWCLIPGKQDGKNILVSFKHGKRLLNIRSFSEKRTPQTFSELHLPEPNQSYSDSTSFNKFVAAEGNPGSILKCLCYHVQHLSQLKLSDYVYDEVLKYLYGNENMYDEDTRQKLRCLPIYKSVSGQRTNLDVMKKMFILPRNMPVVGLDTWSLKVGKLLLERNRLIEPLLIQLGVCLCNEIQFYGMHFFPKFSSIEKEFHMKHLEYVRDCIVQKLHKDDPDDANLMTQLRSLHFIPSHADQDILLRADAFFSPFNTVCAKLCPPMDFPPTPFNSPIWERFMDIAGMKKEITNAVFIKFAKQIENDGRNNAVTQKLQEQSKELVAHMFKRKNLGQSGFLEQIQFIRFIIPFTVRQCLTDIYPSLGETALVCFSESISSEVEHLVWTTCQILPTYADPRFHLLQDEVTLIQSKLGIHKSPPIDKAISHTHNVCFSLRKTLQNAYQRSEIVGVRCLDKTMIYDLMQKIYKYLDKFGKTEQTKCGLSQTPIIHMYEQNLFCRSEQVVLEISREDEIMPYLFKAPVKYGAYFDLFKYLGSKDNVSCKHYADVLATLKQYVGEDRLSPEDIHITRKAVFGFFRQAQNCKDLKQLTEIEQLYLPDEENKLHKASSLVYCNKKSTRMRLTDLEIQYLRHIDFTKENIVANNVLLSLPKHIRPQPLTELVKEELVPVSLNDIIEESSNASAIKSFICSSDFLNVICHLILRDNQTSTNFISSEQLSEVRINIHNIEIYPVRTLQTFLKYKGEIVDESRQNTNCYFCNQNDTWKFYFKDGKGDISKLIRSRLAHLLSHCANNLIKHSFNYLSELVGFVPDTDLIAGYLEENEINIDTDFRNIEDEWFPRLGSYVPKHEYILLNNSFTEFRKGEYVAYEVYDPEVDATETLYSIEEDADDPIYIYVKVIKKSDSESGEPSSPYLRKYDVNMGEGRIESVLVIRLYKFVRQQEEASTELVPFTDGKHGSNTAQEDSILEGIRKTLIDAWKLDKRNRKRIIKRLFLHWHPDKNPGREAFCTRVFQYIQEIIRQLENGEINLNSGSGPSYSNWGGREHHSYGGGGGGGTTYTGSWYSSFGERINRRYHNNWSHYQDNYTTHRHHCRRTRHYQPYIPNPQEHEARRWLKQAKFDLRVADGFSKCSCDQLEDINAYNWICFISQQAAEKAIKAATFTVDANKVTKTHQLSDAAVDQPITSLREKARRLDDHLGRYNQMRYPDVLAFPQTPTELYDKEKADEALKQAQEIVEEVDEYLS